MRMPRWFIDTPSETEIVVNGTAMPCAGGDAEARRVGLRPERHRARRVLAVLADDADQRLGHVVVAMPVARRKARCGARSRPSLTIAERSFFFGGEVIAVCSR